MSESINPSVAPDLDILSGDGISAISRSSGADISYRTQLIEDNEHENDHEALDVPRLVLDRVQEEDSPIVARMIRKSRSSSPETVIYVGPVEGSHIDENLQPNKKPMRVLAEALSDMMVTATDGIEKGSCSASVEATSSPEGGEIDKEGRTEPLAGSEGVLVVNDYYDSIDERYMYNIWCWDPTEIPYNTDRGTIRNLSTELLWRVHIRHRAGKTSQHKVCRTYHDIPRNYPIQTLFKLHEEAGGIARNQTSILQSIGWYKEAKPGSTELLWVPEKGPEVRVDPNDMRKVKDSPWKSVKEELWLEIWSDEYDDLKCATISEDSD